MPASRVVELVDAAITIRDRERRQAASARTGTTLRDQFEFDAYLAVRARHPAYTFRQHLERHARSIEV